MINIQIVKKEGGHSLPLATLRNPSAHVLASDFTLEDLLNGISFQLGSRSIHAYSPKTVQPDQLLEV